MSYEDDKFINRLYKDFNIRYYDGRILTLRNEIIITNF